MTDSLEPRDVHVWYRLTESLNQDAVDRSLAGLSPAERVKSERYRCEQDRRNRALAYSLVRTTLSRYCELNPLDWTFSRDGNGKPVHVNETGKTPGLTFSLSHTPGCVVCAIAPGLDVGVDVERIDLRFDWADVAGRYFGADEIVQLEARPAQGRTTRFVELWTLKEAYCKATGTGLTEPMPRFHICSAGSSITSISSPDLDPHTWQFGLFTVEPHFRVGVAIACNNPGAWTISARNLDAQETTDGHRSV